VCSSDLFGSCPACIALVANFINLHPNGYFILYAKAIIGKRLAFREDTMPETKQRITLSEHKSFVAPFRLARKELLREMVRMTPQRVGEIVDKHGLLTIKPQHLGDVSDFYKRFLSRRCKTLSGFSKLANAGEHEQLLSGIQKEIESTKNAIRWSVQRSLDAHVNFEYIHLLKKLREHVKTHVQSTEPDAWAEAGI
jgi:hypothetical protein